MTPLREIGDSRSYSALIEWCAKTDAVKLQLAELGHRVSPTTGLHGGYQAIWRTDDPLVYFGGSDPRKDGAAMGY